MVSCRHCGQEIRLLTGEPDRWWHVATGAETCRVYGEPEVPPAAARRLVGAVRDLLDGGQVYARTDRLDAVRAALDACDPLPDGETAPDPWPWWVGSPDDA